MLPEGALGKKEAHRRVSQVWGITQCGDSHAQPAPTRGAPMGPALGPEIL